MEAAPAPAPPPAGARPVDSAEIAPEPEPSPAAAPADPPGSNGASIESFLEHVSRQRQPLAAHLASAQRVEFSEGVLRITAPAGDDWLRDALGRKGNRAVLEDCLESVWGDSAKWLLAEGTATAEAEAEPEPEPDHPAMKHPTVQAALDIFGGTVESIEEGER